MTDAESPAPAAGTEEPSIEEILASIRKIISDEPTPSDEPQAGESDSTVLEKIEKEKPEEFTAPVEDVLDLAAYAEESAIGPTPEEHTGDANSDFDLGLEESDNGESMAQDMDISSIMAASDFISSAIPTMPESLISPAVADAATAAFAKLNHASDSEYSTTTQLWVGARTIEQVVEDLLRPMLRTWLDQNLPRLVERLVEKELARMARRASE